MLYEQASTDSRAGDEATPLLKSRQTEDMNSAKHKESDTFFGKIKLKGLICLVDSAYSCFLHSI